jgi:cellulose synthase operon protein C
MFRHPAVLVLVLLLGLPLMAGCGALLGQRFDNFTAYYNAFYNAQQDFDRAERAIFRADAPVDRTRFLSIFPMPAQGGGGGSQAFDSAIRRSADVLRDHPGSRWIDDALLLIGKSYFYQGNYDAAIQKFREVLTVEGTSLGDEATLWLGRALTEARAFGEASFVLRQGIEHEGANSRWTARMRLALGEVNLRQGALAEAAAAIHSGLDGLTDADVAARATFLLGQILETTGDFDEAAEAYQRTIRLRARSELLYAAELQRTLALGRGGRTAEALDRLERLRRDDRFFQQRAEIELVRGRVLAFAGEPEQARQLLYQLLYEPEATMRIDRVRGQIHYRLGEIFRDGLENFPRAAAHFDTASTSLRQATSFLGDVHLTREAVLDVERLAQSYGTYARVHTRIAEMDSLLHLGSLDDEAFEQAIEVIAEQRRRELLAAERERRRIEEQQGFGAGPGVGQIRQPEDRVTPEQAEGGFLSFRNPSRVQENLVAFQARWGDRPRVPGWRRRAAVAAAARTGNGDGDEALGALAAAEDFLGGSLVDISAVPRSPAAYQRMREERSLARYELGNVLFLTLDNPDRATHWYQRVLEEDAEFPIAVRARYALAEIYTDRGDTVLAETLYAQLSELPADDPLARMARQRLGQPLEPVPSDSLALAEQHYASAYARWLDGQQAEALRAMLAVSDHFPRTEAAARARLAAGMIYTEWAARDTLTLLAQSPAALLAPAADSLAHEVTHLVDADVVPDHDASEEPSPLTDHDEVERQEDATTPGDDESAGAPLRDEATDGTILPPELFEPAPVTGNSPPPPASTGPPSATSGASPQPDAAIADEEPDGGRESWLEELYASIERDFPGSRFAQRAELMRMVILEQRLAVEALRREEEERLAEEERFAAEERIETEEGREEERGEVPPTLDEEGFRDEDLVDPLDPSQVPDDAGEAETDTNDEAPEGGAEFEIEDHEEPAEHFDQADLMGEEILQLELGGFSWVVLSTPRSFEAENRLVSFYNAGFRAALLQRDDEDGVRYQVLIGQFATRAEALAARGSLPVDTDQNRTKLIELTPEIEIQSAQDLLSR